MCAVFRFFVYVSKFLCKKHILELRKTPTIIQKGPARRLSTETYIYIKNDIKYNNTFKYNKNVSFIIFIYYCVDYYLFSICFVVSSFFCCFGLVRLPSMMQWAFTKHSRSCKSSVDTSALHVAPLAEKKKKR